MKYTCKKEKKTETLWVSIGDNYEYAFKGERAQEVEAALEGGKPYNIQFWAYAKRRIVPQVAPSVKPVAPTELAQPVAPTVDDTEVPEEVPPTVESNPVAADINKMNKAALIEVAKTSKIKVPAKATVNEIRALVRKYIK